MDQINIQDAKAHLSEVVRRLKAGEAFVLCERNVPVAEIRPIPSARKPRKLGALRGAIVRMSQRFNEPLSGKALAEFQDGPGRGAR